MQSSTDSSTTPPTSVSSCTRPRRRRSSSCSSGNHVIVNTPTGSGKSTVATAAHFAGLATGKPQLVHGTDQSAGQREVLRAVPRVRIRTRRHDHWRCGGQRRRADHLLHRRDPRRRRAARRGRRRRRHRHRRRVPLLRRPAAGVGVAGAAARDAPHPVRPHVGDARRRRVLPARPRRHAPVATSAW